MPIDRLLQGSKLRPEEIERLSLAYARTLPSLCLVDRDDPIAEIVAKKVIEIGASGVSDAAEISKLAVEQLGIRRSPSA
ncbi:L-serine deaminase [Bradyrhizobium sp. USDA 4341]